MTGSIAGYYTLATAQIDFQDLSSDLAQSLPRRKLPVAVLAWLGVDSRYQGQGLGKRLLAQALQDCYQASQVFPFIAVVLDCVDDKARAFYQSFQFASLPGHPYKLYLSFGQLEALLAIAPPHP